MTAARRERVVKIFGAVPDRVVLVSTDFNARPLDEVLRDAGYDRTQRTVFPRVLIRLGAFRRPALVGSGA